ncbi:MAG: ribonuclease H [bacterium]|nr:ribonuclease H [bacterium]
MNLTSNGIIVFTDGASRGNPGPGGWAAVLVGKFTAESVEVIELGGYEERTTNNRMELSAAIEALSFLSKVNGQGSMVIYTDSAYLVNGITKWVFSWERRNWVTVQKEAVLNKDLWETLLELSRGKKIEWKLVGGHVGVAGNEQCDKIATLFADGLPPPLYKGSLENYSVKNILETAEDTGKADEKRESRTRSGKKAYSYVSRVDGRVETHKTWAECENRVKGKSGVKYQKVFSPEEERARIEEWGN